MLIIIIGPSGSGKSSIAQHLMYNHGAMKIVSTTSREPRAGEVDGIHYHFVSKDKFVEMIDNDEFVEFAKYSDNYYGTTKAEIEKKLKSDKLAVNAMEIGGAMKIKELFPETKIVFCHSDIDVLMQRMNDRGDSFENIKKRVKFLCDEKEYDNASKADFILNNNGELKDSCRALEEYLGLE